MKSTLSKKREKIDVLFLVEHIDRELESIKNIEKFLSKKNYSSIILSISFDIYRLLDFEVKLIVVPFIVHKNDWPAKFIRELYNKEIQILNFNWEQLLSPSNITYKKPRDNFVRNEVYHIAWSKNFRNFLIENGVHEQKIKITGNPSYEIINKLFKKKDNLRTWLSQELNLKIEKKWIFLPMNYGWAFSSDNFIKRKIKNGYPEEYAWHYKEYSIKCLNLFPDFVSEINDDYEIIIRPHPSITCDQYKRFFLRKLQKIPKNIYFDRTMSVREWIVSSDIVGSSWSTSVWDAYNLGIPSFLFTPIERPEFLNTWWNDKVLNINNFSQYYLSKSKNAPNQRIQTSTYLFEFISTIINNQFFIKPNPLYKLSKKTIIKLVRSFFYYKKIFKSKSKEYDRFEMIKS